MFIAAIATVGGGLLGAYTARKDRKSMEATNKANAPDPRIAETIFGKGGSGGLLDKYQDLGKTPQGAGLAGYGTGQDSYLGDFGQQDMQKMRDTASQMQGGGDLAAVNAYAQGNMVNAPSQNGLDLKGSYDRMINGDAGANPYLTRALQGGVDQSTQAFDRMQGDSTRNLMENIMPSIRSNSVLSGQYGGSRQGIAEGRAIGDFGREQQRSIENFGNNNTSAILGAQAGAFDAGQNRSLSAMGQLGGQQYGVAQMNAQTKNQAEFMNVGAVNDASRFNAQLSNANKITGLGAQQGLLGQTIGAATDQDQYRLRKAGMTNSLLQPYLTNQPAPQQQMTQSTAGSVVSGAMAGLGLFSKFNQASKPDNGYGQRAFNVTPTIGGN